jgi:3-oxoadipate enol-lactonase
MPFLDRAGKPRLYYELDDHTDPWKPASAVILQHGYARTSAFWRLCVPYLSRFYKVVRPDMRGLGLSGRNFDLATGYSTDALLGDLTDLLDHLGIESVHYCGESSAGTLGMAFAAERPTRVRTLTVVSAPVYMTEKDKRSALHGHANRVEALRKMGGRGWLEASNAGRRFPADTDPRMLQWTLDEMGQADTEVLVALYQFVSSVNMTPLLSKIACPVLGLYADTGVITASEHHEALQRHVKNLRLVRVPGNAHSLQLVKPALTARTLLHFIAACDGIVCEE